MESSSGEVRSSVDAPSTPRRRPRYRLPTTPADDWPTTAAGDWLLQRNEAVAKQAQQDFENAFKKVDERHAAMANTAIYGKASDEQMEALEDTLRGEGDGSIKAPWEIDNCPPSKCPGNKSDGCSCKKGGASGKSSTISCQLFRCAPLSLLRGCISLSLSVCNRDASGWPTNADQHAILFALYKEVTIVPESPTPTTKVPRNRRNDGLHAWLTSLPLAIAQLTTRAAVRTRTRSKRWK